MVSILHLSEQVFKLTRPKKYIPNGAGGYKLNLGAKSGRFGAGGGGYF